MRHKNILSHGSFIIPVLFTIILLNGCDQSQRSAAGNRVADEATLRKTDSTWAKAAEAKQLETHIGYFQDDAVVQAPNEKKVVGKDAIRKMISEMYSLPAVAMSWQPEKVEVAASGDLGYTTGSYQLTMKDEKGIPNTDNGKYLEVWKKQTDGSWKVTTEMFNSDLPVPQPAAK